jgi:hypothetical protein
MNGDHLMRRRNLLLGAAGPCSPALLAIEARSPRISRSRAALLAPGCPRTGIAIRIVGLAAAPSHIAGHEAAIRPFDPLYSALGPDLVVVVTGSGSNHNKIAARLRA